ncbi:MAG TPA: two-component system response regulator, partial [Patescibacteria group bacterium]|nr:two-component system response regulator [Patescibacteria group bacterium]
MGAVNILLIEDDEIDVKAVKRAFRDLKIANPIVEAIDGVEALEILRGENGKEKLSQPYLIMLDLNMPRMGGF